MVSSAPAWVKTSLALNEHVANRIVLALGAVRTASVDPAGRFSTGARRPS